MSPILTGKHILVTRPPEQAQAMMDQLAALGATVSSLPVVIVRPPADWSEVDHAIAELERGEWDWLVFTSIHGVRHFNSRVADGGMRERVKLAAIGPSTAAMLPGDVLTPSADYSSQGLLDALKPLVVGQRVLLIRANRGSELLPAELAKIATVRQVVAYEQVDVVDPRHSAWDALRRGEIDYVTLTSGNIARGFLNACDEFIRTLYRTDKTKLVAISPAVAGVVRGFGFEAIVAETATGEGIVQAIVIASRGGN